MTTGRFDAVVGAGLPHAATWTTPVHLPEVGTQSVVPEVLAGKRELNLRQVRPLAGRFAVPMEVFTA